MRVMNYQFAFRYKNELSSLSNKHCIIKNMVTGNNNTFVNRQPRQSFGVSRWKVPITYHGTDIDLIEYTFQVQGIYRTVAY
jgi:hypothetical protein